MNHALSPSSLIRSPAAAVPIRLSSFQSAVDGEGGCGVVREDGEGGVGEVGGEGGNPAVGGFSGRESGVGRGWGGGDGRTWSLAIVS
jgi:hypothetical protein